MIAETKIGGESHDIAIIESLRVSRCDKTEPTAELILLLPNPEFFANNCLHRRRIQSLCRFNENRTSIAHDLRITKAKLI